MEPVVIGSDSCFEFQLTKDVSDIEIRVYKNEDTEVTITSFELLQ